MENIDHSIIINELGGTCAVAKLFGIAPASVSEWRKLGIPKARMFSIRLLRPDLFGETLKSDFPRHHETKSSNESKRVAV